MESHIRHFGSKCIRFLINLDDEITSSLVKGNVKTRPAKSNGVSCLLLLPSILVIYTCIDNVSLLYKIMTCVSVGLLLYSVLFTIFLSTSCLVLKETAYAGCFSSGLISTALIYVYLKQVGNIRERRPVTSSGFQNGHIIYHLLFYNMTDNTKLDFRLSIFVSVLSTYIFSSLLRISLMKFQKTFTIGEAMIVSQGITFLSVMSVTRYVFNITDADEEMEFINILIYVVMLTIALAAVLVNLLPDAYRNIVGLTYVGVQCAIFALILLHYTLGMFCLPKIISYVFLEKKRWKILLFWLLLVACAVVGLMVKTKMASKADTVARKVFHILASLVFISGVLIDVNLMMLAAGIGFGVIVLVEVLRKSGVEPISSTLQAAFLVYSDEKDCGHFAMTPLYLYCGLWLPLLAVPAPAALERLSGVLATGVGDTAASWGGKRLGLNKWPNSSKTLEGTALNIISQVLLVYALQYFELLDEKNALPRIVIAATASALVEATTDQVDNLVLPPVTLIALQLTSFLTW